MNLIINFSLSPNKLGWIEGASILAAVAIVSTVTAGNDFMKDKQFRELEKEKDNDSVLVLRDGEICQIQVRPPPYVLPLPIANV